MQHRGRQILAIMVILVFCLYTVPVALAGMAGGGQGGGMHDGTGGHGGGTGGHGGGTGGHGGGHGMKNNFMARGTIASVFAEGDLTINVTVDHANHALKDLQGQDVAFTITENTQVMLAGFGLGDLSDLETADVGDKVKLMGKVVPGTNPDVDPPSYEVTRIVLY